MSTRLTARLLALLALTFVLFVMGALTGCYEHVIRSEGYSGKGLDIYEPNFKPGPIERALDGDDSDKR